MVAGVGMAGKARAGRRLEEEEWSFLRAGLDRDSPLDDRLEYGRLCFESGLSLRRLEELLDGVLAREAIRYHIEVWKMSATLPLSLFLSEALSFEVRKELAKMRDPLWTRCLARWAAAGWSGLRVGRLGSLIRSMELDTRQAESEDAAKSLTHHIDDLQALARCIRAGKWRAEEADHIVDAIAGEMDRVRSLRRSIRAAAPSSASRRPPASSVVDSQVDTTLP